MKQTLSHAYLLLPVSGHQFASVNFAWDMGTNIDSSQIRHHGKTKEMILTKYNLVTMGFSGKS